MASAGNWHCIEQLSTRATFAAVKATWTSSAFVVGCGFVIAVGIGCTGFVETITSIMVLAYFVRITDYYSLSTDSNTMVPTALGLAVAHCCNNSAVNYRQVPVRIVMLGMD